jgi:hypothetical protein
MASSIAAAATTSSFDSHVVCISCIHRIHLLPLIAVRDNSKLTVSEFKFSIASQSATLQ